MWHARQSGITEKRSVDDHRGVFERDYTRVIHSPAFRRLQRKKQIIGTNEGDFHRTRLTHSLEVSSIAKSLVKNLRSKLTNDHVVIPYLPCDDLIAAISLLHDIGHPPFGHAGEVALNYVMRDHGGFEANGQTLRLLTKLEKSYGQYGLDLTRRTLLGILKYPVNHQVFTKNSPEVIVDKNSYPPKCYMNTEESDVEWILEPLNSQDKNLFQSIENTNKSYAKSIFKSLDCSIMDLADDIAYGIHDLEDAIYLKLIARDIFDSQEFITLFNQAFNTNNAEQLIVDLFSADIGERKSAIGELVNRFITSSYLEVSNELFTEPLLKYKLTFPEDVLLVINFLKDSVYQHVINSHEARTIEYGGQMVINKIFEAILSNPAHLLNLEHRKVYFSLNDESLQLRVICDYIACMTDEFAYRMHERLFGFNTRTVFEKL